MSALRIIGIILLNTGLVYTMRGLCKEAFGYWNVPFAIFWLIPPMSIIGAICLFIIGMMAYIMQGCIEGFNYIKRIVIKYFT